MTLPPVLGLPVERACERLTQAGIDPVQVSLSGRRREGEPRVIRATRTPQGVLLIATHIRGLAQPQPGAQQEQDIHA